jgi:hypothetical protein
MPRFTAVVLHRPVFRVDVAGSLAEAVRGADLVPVDADDLDDVYAQLNHGSGREKSGYRGRSLSVGDIILPGALTVFPAGEQLGPAWLVAPAGFLALGRPLQEPR